MLATGAAKITIAGTGGSNGGDDNYGVDFESANTAGTAVTAVNGDISVTGTATQATGLRQNGIRLEDSGGAQTFTLATTGTGSISLNGTAGNNDPSSGGIEFAEDTSVSSTGRATRSSLTP